MQIYGALLYHADAAQKLEIISLYREFTRFTRVLPNRYGEVGSLKLVCCWENRPWWEECGQRRTQTCRPWCRYRSHRKSERWTCWKQEKSHLHLKPIIINTLKHSYQRRTVHLSRCLLTHQIIPSNRLWMMRWDWVTTISRVTCVQPNCGERKTTCIQPTIHSFTEVKHFYQHVWEHKCSETFWWRFWRVYPSGPFVDGPASLITQNPLGHIPCKTGGGNVSSPGSGQTCRNLKRQEKISGKT